MNEERVLKVIEDMKELTSNLKGYTQVLECTESDKKTMK